TTIDYPGATVTLALGINGNGDIVGYYSNGSGDFGTVHGFVLKGGLFTALPDFPSAMPGSTLPFGINKSGQIVGYYLDVCSCRSHGFLLDNGVFESVDYPGSSSSYAFAINDAGKIAGSAQQVFGGGGNIGFVLTAGVFNPIIVPGWTSEAAYAINNLDEVVGYGGNGYARGFLRNGTTYTIFDEPDAPAGFETFPQGINDAGTIVGAFVGSDFRGHGFIAQIPDTTPPTITASANSTTLWPPNDKLIPVTVSGTMKDTGPGATGINTTSATYAVSDNYGLVQPNGSIVVGSDGEYSFVVQLPASRSGTDKSGRQYTIVVRVQDNAGNSGATSVVISVPHDQSH
ncbi:MAG TPA: hypothetical protein VKY31_04110, partial [Terriglobia bacterium]|nr:hypothetical protein [Terriglobia bacterium]